MTPIRAILYGARRELIILVGVTLMSLAIVVGSFYWSAQLQQQFDQTQAQTAIQQAELAEKKTDLDNIQTHIEKFKALKQKGLVGTADREGWVEQFDVSRNAVGLAGAELKYALDSPRDVGATAVSPDEIAPPADPAAPLQHDLNFEYTGIHEVELLKFLQNYKSSVDGQFRIQSCELENPESGGLRAKCILRFFNLPDPSKSPLTT